MDENPYKSPAIASEETDSRRVNARFTVPIPQPSRTDSGYRFRRRLAIRVWIGILGGQLLSAVAWSEIVASTQDRTLAGQQYLPTTAISAVIIGWLSYSRIAFLRVVAWMIAGLGLGLIFNSRFFIGDRLGTWLTLNGLLLGCVLAIIGYRLRPPVHED